MLSNVQKNHTVVAVFAVDGAATVTASAGPNGTISPSGEVSVGGGAEQAFTITRNACYLVAAVVVDGVSLGAVASYTFTNVTGNHTIAASFAQTQTYLTKCG